ncbi:MAG TPA: LacI family transcriptional regulator [Providencia sp.]|uniref:ABC transporter substrate-binding protein n=2 Tax=Providencia TaxID=586 RepID=UPI000E9843DC|nr:ABC transporter substrate-binding protein [Providencia sp.]MBP6081520.1 ABC transporter substrate-binding protein [Providencia sp.]HBO24341.1 LacI family transcriptional regulator [Providencia sp.]
MLSKFKTLAVAASVITLGMAFNATAKPVSVGMSFQELNNEYFVTMKEALESATGDIGAQLYISDAAHDVSKQTSDIEDMLQKKIDILLINPADSVGAETAVLAAKKAGVVVIAIDAQANGPIDSFVGSKNYDAGLMAGKHLGEALGGKGNVAILDGIPVVPILERVRGFEAAMKEYPNIKIVTKLNGKQERDTAMNVTENMLQANPTLNGIFSVNDVGSLGALAAIESSGRDVKLVSVDGSPEAVAEIAKGNSPFIATSAQFPRDQVRIGLAMGLAKYWGANVPKEVPIDVKLIDKTNAKDFRW